MMSSRSEPTAAERARREEVWRSAQRDIETRTRSRLRDVARCIGLEPRVEPAFVAAVSELARQHAAALAYAHYEYKEGYPWPDEQRFMEEQRWSAEWEAALERLQAHCPEA